VRSSATRLAGSLPVLGAALGVAALVVSLSAAPVSAHPLGNFTVNRAAALRLAPWSVSITYVIDMAEIPTFQELPRIDRDGDGLASAAELDRWAAREASVVAPDLAVTVDGRSVALASADASATLRPGQGGLSILRFEATYTGELSEQGVIAFRDRTDDGRIGWHEVTATGTPGVSLADSTVPTTSPSDLLRSYPSSALQSPSDVTSMSARFAPGAGTPAGADGVGRATGAGDVRPAAEAVPLAGVLDRRGAALVLLGLVIAVAFGAWHALLPGHGKTLMAAAMVGGGASTAQAVRIAAAVAAMHTSSVLTLGGAVLALQATFRPEVLYPWLGVLSGLAALAIGAGLVRGRLDAWRAQRHRHADASVHADGDTNAHGHHHPHAHALGTADGRLGRRGLVGLALAGGILPAPSALLVMLAAIQVHRVAYGLALVGAFSVGLAASLAVVGVGALKARDALARRVSSLTAVTVPLVSALAIVAVGAFLTVRAVAAVVAAG
jgi:ABC-type nickel/cobalt efflux system permease component RcnA